MQTRPTYIRPAARALAIARENFSSWLYFSQRSASGLRKTATAPDDEPRRWESTKLARFFGLPGRPAE